jgi:hypothetical protein
MAPVHLIGAARCVDGQWRGAMIGVLTTAQIGPEAPTHALKSIQEKKINENIRHCSMFHNGIDGMCVS